MGPAALSFLMVLGLSQPQVLMPPDYMRAYLDRARFLPIENLKTGWELADNYNIRLELYESCLLSWEYERKAEYDALEKEVNRRRNIWWIAWDAADDLRLADEPGRTPEYSLFMRKSAFIRYETLREKLGEKDFWDGRLPLPIPYEALIDVD